MSRRKWIIGLILLLPLCISPIQDGSIMGTTVKPAHNFDESSPDETTTPNISIALPKNETKLTPPFRVAWNATDKQRILSYSLSVNGTELQSYFYTNPSRSVSISVVLNRTNFNSSGWKRITITARDYSLYQNTTKKTLLINISLTGPGLIIESPPWRHLLESPNFTLRWRIGGGTGEIAGFNLYRDGVLNRSDLASSKREASLVFPQEGLAHNFTLIAVDSEDTRLTSDSLVLLLDTIPPQVHFTLNKTRFANDFYATWEGDGTGTSIKEYRLVIDDTEETLPGGCTSYKVVTTIGDGNHTMKLTAVDEGGNTNSTGNYSFLFDTKAPFILPALEGGVYDNVTIVKEGGKVTVRWIAYDETTEISNLAIKLDGGNWTSLKPDASKHSFNNIKEGTHQVRLKAIDSVGNAAVITAEITVAGELGIQQIWYWIVIGEVASILGLAVGLPWIRKKRVGDYKK